MRGGRQKVQGGETATETATLQFGVGSFDRKPGDIATGLEQISERAISESAGRLRSLREDGVRGALALNVDRKIRQGAQLTETENRVLWLGITQEQVRFVKENLLSL